MGLRLYSEFKSSNGKQYKIEIYDNEWTPASSSFNVTSEGFDLQYNGETDDIVSPIVASQCVIQAYNTDSVFDTFLTHLQQHQEDRFTMRILLHDGSNYNMYWAGVILQDLVSDEDAVKPRVVEITATDGIGFLANKEYETIADVTIEDFIESAVNAIGLDDLYSSTDAFYATTVNVWDTNMTYSATTDVSTLIKFNSRVFTTREEDGTTIYTSYLDILRELCVGFGARFYQQEGVYQFEQYLERVGSSRTKTTYQFDGTKISTASASDDVTLDQTTSGGARRAGNTFNYLPALKRVSVTFNQDRASNLLASRIVYTNITPRQSIGFVPNTNSGRLTMETLLTYQLTLNTTPGSVSLEFYRPLWRIEIRVEDINNAGTFYYLKRDYVGGTIGGQLYGATSWTTTPSYYVVDGGVGHNDATGLFLQAPLNLATLPLPVSGEVEIDINFWKVLDQNHNLQTIPSYFDETFVMEARRVTFVNDSGSLSAVEVFSAVNTDVDINSNLSLHLGELRISDAFGLQGSFFIYNGSSWVRSTLWRRGNSGSYQSLYKVLTSEVLSLHKKPIERYDGAIISTTHFGERLIFDSKTWIMLRGSYSANTDEWRSEWFEIAQDSTNITTGDPVGSGGGGNPPEGMYTQQGTADIVYAIEINTETSDVNGNQTIGGTLGVTGASTLATTSVGEFTTTDRVNVTINDITANAGGSETISLRDHFNFITHQGGGGTYTINLPSSEDGVILRFKTDDTISNSNDISIVPQSGERIDAEATYTMDRSYDGITLMGKSQNWFIIQKKEK